MNNEEEFLLRYRREKGMYKAWGNYLVEQIEKELGKYYVDFQKILKIPPSCRVKEEESLLEKAFYREKEYTNPYEQIEDKVGIRFVVMLEKHVDQIGKIIESFTDWLSCSRDQDYNVLRETNPEVFTYQSRHYVVRNKHTIVSGEYTIPEQTPCEIQIRTLGQHAYAEVSHDLFYKSKMETGGKALRFLARTAAFNEESDELFGRLYEMADEKEREYSDFVLSIKKLINFPCTTDKLNRAIYENIIPLINKYDVNIDKIKLYLHENVYIKNFIEEKQDKTLFRQPIVVVLYYLLDKHGYEFEEIWDFQEDILDSIKTDLGISMN